MKSSAPWSVKGVERDARETAKEAARREGMTVGEWLNQVIYTASDPASSNGQIEGLKISDLVNAIEHVSRRVIGAEGRTAEGFEELARGLSGVVERVQRLERHRPEPSAGGAPAEFETRLAALESRAGDRERIEALKALERALGQVAAQFDAAQKSSADRLQAIERRIEEVGGRIDADRGGMGGAIDHLKNTVDGVSARLARLERSSQEQQKARPEPAAPAPGADPEFIERTGVRLRVLGEEIKRGGDQIRGLEGSIRKLAAQIDAAERRSSEGVQKVAETISELRSQIGDTESQRPAEARADIDAAIAETARRTEQRINDLQRSFELLLNRLETARPAPLAQTAASQSAAPQSAAFQPSAPQPSAPQPSAGVSGAATFRSPEPPTAPIAAAASQPARAADAAAARDVQSEELKEALSAFDLDFDTVSGEPAAEPDAAGGVDLDFELGEETAPDADASQARGILAEVEAAFGSDAGAPAIQPKDAPAEGSADDIDSILAELEGYGSDKEDGGDAEPAATTAPPLTAQKPAAQNYLQEARRAAKEAAERAAAQAEGAGRRKLTPKQRAILAAKIRRKRLAAEQAAAMNAAETAAAAAADGSDDPSTDEPQGKRPSTSLFAGAAAAIGRLAKTRAAGKKTRDPEEPVAAREGASGAAKIKPLTLALGAAVVLAGVAVVLPVKDLLTGSKPKAGAPAPRQTPRQDSRQDSRQPGSAPAATAAAPATTGEAAPLVPEPPVIKPRALFLDSVARLRTAQTDGERRAALKGIEDAAALGHPPAQLQLGEIYRVGQGTPVDLAKARAWFERAANGGNMLAMHRLGVMAARGQGGPVDQLAAISWFEKAAALGLVDSQYNLGAIYHPGSEGNAGVQDAAKAYFWYMLASRKGDDQAGSLAAGLAGGLSPAQRRDVDARLSAWTEQTPDPDANENAQAS